VEEKIERILIGELHCLNNDDEVKPYLRMKAAEIAKLVKEREADFGYEIELLNEEVDWHKVKLAEMREVLDWSLALHSGHQRHPEWSWHYEISMCRLSISKALSAAPEVLWAGEGTAREMGDRLTVRFAGNVHKSWAAGQLEIFEAARRGISDGQQVKVIVTRKRDDEKPKP